MPKAKPSEKAIFERWYILTNTERKEQKFPITQKAFKKSIGVSAQTLNEWSKDCRFRGIYPPKKIEVKWKKPTELPAEMREVLDYVPLGRQGFWNDERTAIVNEAILESARHGNANAQKLAKQLAGELVEKKEVTLVISADDYFRIRREAQSRIREVTGEGDRDRGVQSEPTLLLPKDGVPSEQEHYENSEVGSVGLST